MGRLTQEQFIDAGGAAFPWPSNSSPGMSLRDYFAGQVLIGLIAMPGGMVEDPARTSYVLADAMLAERLKDADNPPQKS